MMPERRSRRWRDRLGTRLAAVFMVTALATVFTVTAIAWTASSTGVDALLAQRREQVAVDVVVALESAYLAAGGWEGADLLPAHTLAVAAGAVLIVTTPELGELPTPPDLDVTRDRLRGPDGPIGGPGGATPPRVDERTGDAPDGVPGTGPADADDQEPTTSREPGADTGEQDAPSDEVSQDIGSGTGDAPEEPERQRQTEGEGTPPPDTGQEGLQPGGETSDRGQHGPDLGEPRAEPPAETIAWAPTTGPGVWATDGQAPAVDTVHERRVLPILVGGRQVGTATLVFVDLGLTEPDERFREAVTQRLVVGAGAALVLALLATAFVTSRLTRPLRRLTAEVDGLRRAGATPVRPVGIDAPGEIGILADALARMVDDLRRQERLRQALVADVEHELRTPVTILLGEIEALRDGVLTADEEQLGSLQEEVQRIARLVEDVGALADAESAGFSLDLTSLDLAAVTATATRALEPRLAAAELELRLDLDHVRIEGDPRRLEQLVRNLLTNAGKFATPGTAIEVSVRADGDDAILEVADRGPGFDADELEHVFARFWRGRRVGGVGGSGIGLAVVDEVARAHGGGATASNRPGGGARLTVRLPRATTPATRVARGRCVPVGPGTDGGGACDSSAVGRRSSGQGRPGRPGCRPRPPPP